MFKNSWTLTIITAWKKFAVRLLSNKQCVHLTMSLFLFFFYALNFCMELSKTWVHCKGEFYMMNIQKLSLDFSHCLCGCWYKGINLWPHQILAWTIVVCFFEQHRSWVCSAILVSKSSVMKSLKNSTGREECSTNRLVFSNLRPVMEELGTTEILLQS